MSSKIIPLPDNAGAVQQPHFEDYSCAGNIVEPGASEPSPPCALNTLPVTSAEDLLFRITSSSVYEVFNVEPPSQIMFYAMDNAPPEMQRDKAWLSMDVRYNPEKGGFDKKPICFDGVPSKWSSPTYHRSFSDVRCFVGAKMVSGFAYVMKADAGLVCVDLDNCIENGQLKPFAMAVIKQFRPTYTELSVSRNGLHLFCRAALPFSGSQKVITLDGHEGEIEMYAAKRLISMTGLTTAGWHTLELNQEAIDQLAALMKPPREAVEREEPQTAYDPPQELIRLKSALDHISANQYWTWLQVLMALYRYGYENKCMDDAWELFDWWSRRTTVGNYDAEANRYTWDYFDEGASFDPVTLGTVYYLAKENGWTFDSRQLSSAENGVKGGRPESIIDHADAADRFYNAVVKEDGEEPALRYNHGTWYRYHELNGWSITTRDEVQSTLTTFMQNDTGLRSFASNHYINSVMTNLQSHNYCGTMSDMPVWIDTGEGALNWVAFGNGKVADLVTLAKKRNGILPQTDVSRPKSPAFFSPSFVRYDINFMEIKAPLFEKYLETVLPDKQSQKMLQELAGLVLSDLTSLEVFYVLLGKGANGKTVFLDILMELVGRQNVSYVDLHMLGERFQDFPLASNKVNICGELMTDLGRGSLAKMEGKLKHFVSGGEIEVERKGQDKYTATCRARFIMATNSLPTFIDRSDAIWRRMRVIKFPITVPESDRDPELARKIISQEMPAVFTWAMEGLERVLHNGKVSESDASKAVKGKHRRQCDKELVFMEECCVFGQGFTTNAALYGRYEEWCQANGYGAFSREKFFARLEDDCPCLKRVQRKVSMNCGTKSRQRGFDGVVLAERDDNLRISYPLTMVEAGITSTLGTKLATG